MCLQFPKLPMELQRSIFMMLKDERDVRHYAHVAKRTHVWLSPSMYYTIRLWHEETAIAFIIHIKECSFAQHVMDLYIGRSVTIYTTVQIIMLCRNLTILTLQFPLRYITSTAENPLLAPLDGLQQLRILYTSLASTPLDRYINLLDFEPFRRVSHLHLGSGLGAGITIPRGFTSLPHLTHLSLHWSTSRYCASNLRAFLRSDSAVILITWTMDYVPESTVERDLTLQGLADPRVVLFRVSLMAEYISDGGFWEYVHLTRPCLYRYLENTEGLQN
ncbi:hypothetical protein HD554DRAFT_2035296 [Boletus coccyginus]|nr:hypothetical protein HD554DRAFT_2035296 [Boletus coccyginus]